MLNFSSNATIMWTAMVNGCGLLCISSVSRRPARLVKIVSGKTVTLFSPITHLLPFRTIYGKFANAFGTCPHLFSSFKFLAEQNPGTWEPGSLFFRIKGWELFQTLYKPAQGLVMVNGIPPTNPLGGGWLYKNLILELGIHYLSSRSAFILGI